MGDPASLIERLRPLHPPASDGTAEILVMALIGSLCAALLSVAIPRLVAWRRPIRRAALAALADSREMPAQERIAAQARMLRDVARAMDAEAGALSGDAWLLRLDAMFGTQFFSDGPGRAFGDRLYRPPEGNAAQALDDTLVRLLARLKR